VPEALHAWDCPSYLFVLGAAVIAVISTSGNATVATPAPNIGGLPMRLVAERLAVQEHPTITSD